MSHGDILAFLVVTGMPTSNTTMHPCYLEGDAIPHASTCTCIHMHVLPHVHASTCMCFHMYMHPHACTSTCTCIHMHVIPHVHASTCIFFHMHASTCMCFHMYMYTLKITLLKITFYYAMGKKLFLGSNSHIAHYNVMVNYIVNYFSEIISD